MEGVLDIWEGLMSGWRSHFVTLFNENLIISEFKGGPVKFKVVVSDMRIDPKSERDTKFSITSGNSSWELNARDIRDKIKWISTL
jgi:hypothetical protein